ncbi:hypothetical protein AB3M95_15945 [Metabacillus niabensis]
MLQILKEEILERELWAGKVAYELGDLSKARDYLDTANKKSRGRCFSAKMESI